MQRFLLSVSVFLLCLFASASSQAVVTAAFSAGPACGSSNNISYVPGGPAVKVSLCVTSTTDYLCGISYRIVPASTGDNGLFRVEARELAVPFEDANNPLTLPAPIASPVSGDWGATVNSLDTCTPPGDAVRVATYDIAGNVAATANEYAIMLDLPFSSASVGVQATLALLREVNISASFILRKVTSGGSTPATQTIEFAGPPSQVLSTTPIVLTASASSGLVVTFTSLTPSVCSVSGASVSLLAVGTCTIAANQSGNTNFSAAAQVTRSFSIAASTPGAPDLATLSLAVTPLPPIITGQSITMTALVRMRNPAGSVTFSTAQGPITGCVQRTIAILADATDAATSTCSFVAAAVTLPVPPVRQMTLTYFYPAGHPSGRTSEQISVEVPASTATSAPPDYTDMWWGGMSENGWGVSITQHGAVQFNVIFAYDNLGKPLWYVMPGGSWNASNTTFNGPLFRPTSAPFSAYNRNQFVPGASVGTASINFTGNGTATLSYVINGVSDTKSIQRQVFANETGQARLVVNDLWWAGEQEDGWGMNIAQQGRVLFPVWYTYDATGKTIFYTVPGGTWNGTAFTGDIYTTTSSAWLGVSYGASQFVATKAGTMTLDFADQNNATMRYTVNGVTQTKSIVRQAY